MFKFCDLDMTIYEEIILTCDFHQHVQKNHHYLLYSKLHLTLSADKLQTLHAPHLYSKTAINQCCKMTTKFQIKTEVHTVNL